VTTKYQLLDSRHTCQC